MKNKGGIRFVATAGVIAALYVVMTLASWPLSYGPIQVRLSEMLCVLPCFTPAAIPGLFIGCLLSNLFSTEGLLWEDVVFGALATLLGALGAYLIGRKQTKASVALATIPEVVFNVIAVPLILKYGYGIEDALWFLALTVGAGEVIACCVLGIPFGFALRKLPAKVFGKKPE